MVNMNENCGVGRGLSPNSGAMTDPYVVRTPSLRFAAVLVALAAFAAGARAQVVTWNGNANWANSPNWSSNNVPGNTDTAQVNSGTVDVADARSVGALALGGGTVTGNGTLTLVGAGSTWTGGSMTGSGTLKVAAGAALTISSGSNHDFNGRALVNEGTVNWTEGYLRSGNGGTITNASGATFNATANGYSAHVPGDFGGSFTFTNHGTFARSGAGTTTFDVAFNNTGAVNVTGGRLALNGGGSSSGQFTVTGAGSELVLANGYSLASGAALSGAVRFTSGTLTALGEITAAGFVFEGGTLLGTQTFSGGTVTWSGGNWNADASTTIASGASLVMTTGNHHDFNGRQIINNGTTTWEAGYLRGGSGSTFTNNGTFLDRNGSSYTLHVPGEFGGSFTFVNNGTYDRTAGGTTTFHVPFNNNGTLDLKQGTVEFHAGGTLGSSGRIVAASDTNVYFRSSYTIADGSSLSGTGGYFLTDGTLTIPGSLNVTKFVQTGGAIAGTNTLNGIFEWSGGNWNAPNTSFTTTVGVGASLVMGTGNHHDFNARQIVNNGTTTWHAGYLRGGSGSTFTNNGSFLDRNGSSYTLHVPGEFGGSFVFTNNGTYERDAGGTTGFDIPFDNNGTLDLKQGNVEFRAGGTLGAAATIKAASGTNVYFRESYTISDGASLTGAGTYWLTGGTLTVPGALDVTTFKQTGGSLAGTNSIKGNFSWEGGNWNAGTAGATTTILTGAALTMSTGNHHDFNRRNIVNSGTTTWTGGYIRAGSGSMFTNNGAFLDQNAGSYTFHVPGEFGGSFSFTNNGTYERNAGGTTGFDIPFDNNGTFDLKQGNVEFRAGGTLAAAATIKAASGTNVYFRESYTLANGSSLTGAGTYWLTGGTLTVPGTLDVTTFKQTGGSLAGTNTLKGTFEWTGGNWNAANNTFTTTVATGAALSMATGNHHDFNARNIVNNGTTTWTSGYIRAGSGSTFTNNGTFSDLNAGSYSFHVPGEFGGTFSFTNNGSYVRNAGGTTYFDIPFDNNSTLELKQGNVEFRAGGTSSATGKIDAVAGTNVYFRNNYTIQNGASLAGLGNYWLTDGTLTLSGNINVGSFTQTGGALAGTSNITGNFTWSGGNWNAGAAGPSTTVAAGATLTISSGNHHDFAARTITNNGTTTWTQGYLRGGNGSAFVNNGTFSDLNAGGYSLHVPGEFGGAFLFTNNGTYVRDTTGITYFDVPLNNNAALQVKQGELQLRAGGTMSANSVVTVSSGARLYFTNNYTLLDGAQLTGTGLINHIAGTLTLNGSLRASSFLWSGGNWNAANDSGLTTTIAAGTVLTMSHANDNVRDLHGRGIVNSGTVNWESAYIRGSNGSTFVNNAVFNDKNAGSYSIHNPNLGGSFTFTNNGTYDRNVTGTTHFNIPFLNNGTVALQKGDIELHGNGTMSATSIVNASTGARLFFRNDYTLLDGAQFNGDGLFNQTGGKLTLNGTLRASSFLWSGGNWNAVNNSGLTTTIGAGTTLVLTHANDNVRDFHGRSIVNAGTVNWESAYLRGSNGSIFVNNAVFNDKNAGGYSIHNPNLGGTFVFTNNGTYDRNVGGTTYFDTTFDNNGLLKLQQGEIRIRSGGTMSATSVVNASSGTNLYFTDSYTLQNGAQFTGAGTIRHIAGTLTIDGALRASNFVWSGGNWNAVSGSGAQTTIANGTTITLTHGNDNVRDFHSRGIVNQGVVNWESGYLRGSNGSSFLNAANGTFNDLNAGGYTIHNPNLGGTFTFTNNGVYTRSVGGTTFVDVPFTNNNGAIFVNGGTLHFRSAFQQTAGTLMVANNATARFDQTLNFAAGILGGAGTLHADVQNSGLLTPGNSIGQLNITGNLTLLGTSNLLFELGGTTPGAGHDFLSVGGAATLGGNLSLQFVNGFGSSVLPTTPFTLVSANTLTGVFANAPATGTYTFPGFGTFDLTYGATSVMIANISAVPEPSTWALMISGALLVAWQIRRRRR